MIISPTNSTVAVQYDAVNDVANELITFMSESNVTVGVGSLAAALVVGRLLSPAHLDESGEVTFVQGILEWIGAYFAHGGHN